MFRHALHCVLLLTALCQIRCDTDTFSFTGSVQTWTVPAGVSSIESTVCGAEGMTTSSNDPVSYMIFYIPNANAKTICSALHNN